MCMSRPPELRPSRWDALVVLAVLALAALVAARTLFGASDQSPGGLTVIVSVDGEEVERAPLSAYAGEHRYAAGGYTLTVSAEDGTVAVSQSDCPGQDCVHTGPISRAGQSIVCLPARVAVTLTGASGGYDLVTG